MKRPQFFDTSGTRHKVRRHSPENVWVFNLFPVPFTACLNSVSWSRNLIFLKLPQIIWRICKNIPQEWGTRWRSWLRHCATSRKVAVSIPDGVTGIFLLHNPSGRTMALGLTQPLTEMSTRNISLGVKRPVRRTDNLTTFICRLSWNLEATFSWNPQGLSRPVMGLLYLFMPQEYLKPRRIFGPFSIHSSGVKALECYCLHTFPNLFFVLHIPAV